MNTQAKAIPCSSAAALGAACGKVILAGEHAVVYGARALALPLRGRGVSISLGRSAVPAALDATVWETARAACMVLEEELGGARQGDKTALAGIASLKEGLASSFRESSLRIEVSSTLPLGAGLGSSASFCVALLRAVCGWIGLSPDAHMIAGLANRLEVRFHERPSGLDAAVISLGKALLFRRSMSGGGALLEGVPIAADLPGSRACWRWVLVDSAQRSATKTMVARAARHFTGSAGERLVVRFDELAGALTKAVSAGDFAAAREAIAENARLLESIDVVTEAMKGLGAEMRGLGADAVKPTGAGGGGMLLGLLPEQEERRREVENAIARKHAASLFFSTTPVSPNKSTGDNL